MDSETPTLDLVLDNIQSDKLKDREKGVTDLKHILTVNRNNPELKTQVKDKSIHFTFKTLFPLVSSERAIYVSSGSTKALSATRLTSYGSVVRLAVEVFLQSMRANTVQAIVNHVIHMLGVGDGGLCKPLSLHYLKALTSIVSYVPHVEQLTRETWLEIADFCIAGMKSFAEDTGPVKVDFDDIDSFELGPTARSQSFATRRKVPVDSKENTLELVKCLSCLVSATNCPILGKAQDLLTAILEYLQSPLSTTPAYQAAFKIINTCLTAISVESLQLMTQSLRLILPLMRNFWMRKEKSLRDEILVTLIRCEAHLAFLAGTEQGEIVLPHVESLFETIHGDYLDAGERNRLDLAHLALGGKDRPPVDVMPMRTASFLLRKSTRDSEYNWTLLHFVAFFANWIDLQKSYVGTVNGADQEKRSTKRLRTSSRLDELLDTGVSKISVGKLIPNLQVLAFLLDRRALTEKDAQSILDSLIRNVSHDNPDVASWALMAIASCTFKVHRSETVKRETWLNIWHLALRLISSAPHCRAAAHVLDSLLETQSLLYEDVADSIDSLLFSVNLNGPSSLCDSSLAIWSNISQRKALHNPGQSGNIGYDQMLSWLCNKWSPSQFENRSYAFQISSEVSVKNITRAFDSLLGHNAPIYGAAGFAGLGLLGQNWLAQWHSRSLPRYLLLLDDNQPLAPRMSWADSHIEKRPLPAPHARSDTETYTMNFFVSEIEKTAKAWLETKTNRSASINEHMMHVVFSLCIVGSMIIQTLQVTHEQRCIILKNKLSNLTLNVVSFAFATKETVLVDTLLEGVAPFLPNLSSSGRKSDLISASSLLSVVLENLAPALERRREEFEDEQDGIPLSEDPMDFEVESQRSLPSPKRSFSQSRDEITAISDARSFTLSVRGYIQLLWVASREMEFDVGAHHLPQTFAKYLTSLSAEDLLASRPLIKMLLSTEIKLTAKEAEDVIVHFVNTLLTPYEWYGCEVSICLCVDVMIGTVSLWTDQESSSIADTGADLYEWLFERASKNGMYSTNAQISLANLLYRLLEIDPDYAEKISKPSVRTTLFGILKDGDLVVQHHVVQRLPSVFQSFVLSQHELIFNDIHESLPSDLNHLEGINIRLLVFSYIGSAWRNLLRHCLYHIFETAGLVPDVSHHAKYCIGLITRSLELVNSQKLFTSFSSQLLYTWLASETLQAIPYIIFDYSSLQLLIEDVKGELLSQIIMRGSDDLLKEFESTLGQPAKDVLDEHFGQAIAYGVATDMGTVSSSGVPSHNTESRIRDLLGKNHYRSLLHRDFPCIIGHLFKRLEQEDQVEKMFSKKQDFEYAAGILEVIKNTNASTMSLPQSQQPSFKSKMLLDEIERICRRTNQKAIDIWTPTLVLRVSRMLVNDIEPVYGPLHACRVIQRLRILICLAGSTATAGYPLELLLQALRPYVTDKLCADDALGTFQYLMDRGKVHLSRNPTLVAGVSIVLFLSLRDFLRSTQDNTTQESHHRATLSKASSFRTWLAQYVEDYKSDQLDAPLTQKFHDMLACARNVNDDGNALRDSHEGKLLLHLLDETATGNPTLGSKYTQNCFQLLTKDFNNDLTFREDILGLDRDAAHFSVAIWKSLRDQSLSRSFQEWAARVLGRGFGFTGHVETEIVAETNLKALKAHQPNRAKHQESSGPKASIVHALVELLLNNKSLVVDLTERALQYILQRYRGSDDVAVIENCLPATILETFSSEQQSLWLGKDKSVTSASKLSVKDCFAEVVNKSHETWARDIALAMAYQGSDEPILEAIIPLLDILDDLAHQLFPFILHLLLLQRSTGSGRIRETLSQGFGHVFRMAALDYRSQVKLLLDSTLYLRSQPKPRESTPLDRNEWLALDFTEAATAANTCKMYKTALIFTELSHTLVSRRSRKSSAAQNHIPNALFESIFKNIDEPDSFYGVEQASDLNTIAERLEYEGNNVESLLFRGAQSDSLSRGGHAHGTGFTSGIIQSLAKLGLNAVSESLAMNNQNSRSNGDLAGSVLKSALKLRKWDIAVTSTNGTAESAVYRMFQALHSCTDSTETLRPVRRGMLDVLEQMKGEGWAGPSILPGFQALTSASEVEDLLRSHDASDFAHVWGRLEDRDHWLQSTLEANAYLLLTGRDAFSGILKENKAIQESLHMSPGQSSLAEVLINLQSSRLYRQLGSFQESLSNVTYLSSMIADLREDGNYVDASIRAETANILWQRGELVASVKTLQDLVATPNMENETIGVGRAGLLADLANRVSYGRLEKAEDILNNYLRPAGKELGNTTEGPEAGKVFHEYATYCHNQLDSPDSLNELRRSERFRRQRTAEMRDLKSAISTSKTDKEKHAARKEYNHVKSWLKIDEQEHSRLRSAREHFLKSSLEHYLRSLAASEEFNTDVIRFLAIWLAHADSTTANKPVGEYAPRVPSRKFTSLMNQLGSRLQETDNDFQRILSRLVLRICQEHPYHGMYHIFAGSKTSGGNDSQAQSRKGAASRIAKHLEKDSQRTGATWESIRKSNELYNKMAKLRSEETKQGAKLSMKQFDASRAVERDVPAMNVPPVTMTINIREDLDYSDIPIVHAFRPEITIPSGISAPKIITAIASNGQQYKQLFKGGTDDLRQDAIMEQVFDQVTELLKKNKSTRQRNLGIRTYRVVPLDGTSGVIEFVEPTMSLNDFLADAHHRYNPHELKWKACRDKMSESHDTDHATRIKVFKDIKSRFSPVLRHFFFERFEDPDEWFERRLAYTRSTAAISILGYVVGLGDRHCQNILLDTSTGEVVHIDLGVAFEAGRVLPKPETVPFRLTRDVVDGFGVLKTEGVFRRCCEFTLEALRQNKDTIITLLNVLRYDPLYSWSVSPLRQKRLQDEQESRRAEERAGSIAPSKVSSRRQSGGADVFDEEGEMLKDKNKESEGGEAERALHTVEKKLSTGLSVSATVNELIQQATDDKNLAVLFHGWAPYA